ncbi:MAG TPA: dTDP-4-dehydrorhamnose reductase [Gemmatimonadaceae bacterium]|nr:dTDP-4-dehydrorhamnose reductase [Gemmatimonadaceae bacterium]
MRALVTGAEGQLGRHLVATAPRDVAVEAVGHEQCDITDPQAVARALESFQPDVVINTAAYTSVDAAEDNEDLAFLVNARAPELLARAAARGGARLIHISTDYVFDGSRSTPYPPDAPTNPLNTYGASKLEGERLAQAAASSTLIVRVGWLYSKTGKNFLSRIAAGNIAAPQIRVVRDQVGCPTSAREFALALWRAARSQLSGVYHWANLGQTTWYDFALECGKVAGELNLSDRSAPEIVGVTSEEFPSRARRPRYSVLDPARLAAALGISPSSWIEALRAEMQRAG